MTTCEDDHCDICFESEPDNTDQGQIMLNIASTCQCDAMTISLNEWSLTEDHKEGNLSQSYQKSGYDFCRPQL